MDCNEVGLVENGLVINIIVKAQMDIGGAKEHVVSIKAQDLFEDVVNKHDLNLKNW